MLDFQIQGRPTATIFELVSGSAPPPESIIQLEVGGPTDGIELEDSSGNILLE